MGNDFPIPVNGPWSLVSGLRKEPGRRFPFCKKKGSLSNVGVSSNSSTTHGRERFLLTSVFILISPSKAVKSENGIVQSCESQMLLSLTP